MTQIRFAAAAVVLALVPAAAGAQVLQERNMPLAIAQEIAQATVEACAAKNFNVAATVVDRVSGILRTLQSGMLYHYAFAMILGLIALLGALIWVVR